MTILVKKNYNENIRKKGRAMFKKRFSILKFVGFVLLAAVVLFFVFKASITGNIV